MKSPTKILLALLLLPAMLAAQTNKVLSFSLSEFLSKVRTTSLDIKSAAYDPAIALGNYHELRDAFTPMVTLGAGYGNPSGQNNYITNGSFSAGVSKFWTETGTGLNLGWSNGMFAQSPGKVAAVSPGINTWGSVFSVGLNQSLLRGAPWASAGSDNLEMLRQLVKIQKSAYNTRVAGILFGALSSYWSLDLNRKLLKLSEESITDAKDLLEKNRRRVEVGTVDISDVYRSEVNLTFSENNRDDIQRNIENGEAQILNLLGETNLSPNQVEIQVPVSLAWSNEVYKEDELIEVAYKNRKEIEQARLSREMAFRDLHSARVSLLPKLDAFASLTVNGWDTNNGSLDDALANIGKGATNNVGWFAGLRFETPLDPAAYATVVEKREAAYKKALDAEQQARRAVRQQIQQHLANLKYYADVLGRSKEALDISDRKVAELRRQFNNGRINSLIYLQGYEEQRSVQRIYYSTLFAWELERNNLKQTQGIFLKSHGQAEMDANAAVK